MAKNYEALKHIREQLSSYDENISQAIQRLFNIEDQCKECQGCVIDTVVTALIFNKYGIKNEIHLGEICADGEQDAYHCWLTVDNKIVDIGIYGNANYNPYYHGQEIKYPFILEDTGNIKYCDGSTETISWLAELSEKSIPEYIKHCPQNRVCKLIYKSLDIMETKENYEMIMELAKDMYFPKLKHIEVSPSGKRGF